MPQSFPAEIWYGLRCWLCEILVSLSLKVCPEEYTPSYIAAVIEAAENFESDGEGA
jgi:hypothetical protein